MEIAMKVVASVESSLDIYSGGIGDRRCCCILLEVDLGFLMPTDLMFVLHCVLMFSHTIYKKFCSPAK